MAKSDSFKAQHKELLGLVGDLQKLLNPAACAAQSAAIRDILGKIAGKITMHLNMEDLTVYKLMLANPTSKPIAERFSKEMGGIKDAFTKYIGTYNTPTAISGNAAKFISDTNGIITALGNRIKKEEAELYVAFDKL